MTDLPDGWEWESIEGLARHAAHALAIGPFGSNLKVVDYRDEGVPLIFVRHIRARNFDGFDPKFVDERKADDLAAHVVRAGDVLVTKMGEPPGDACVYPDRRPAVLTADCIKITPHECLDARYMAHLIEAPQFRAAMRTITQGVAQRKVSLGRFRKLRLPVAPFAEQDRIVSAIEEHLSRLDVAASNLVRARRRTAPLLDRLLDGLHSDGSVDVELQHVLDRPLANGRSVRTDPSGFPVLRLTALRDRRVNLSERKGGEWTEEAARPYLVERGDFLVSRGNGSLRLVGRGGLVDDDPDPVAYPDTLIRVRVNPHEIDARYLALVWDSRRVRQQIERQARTTAGIYKVNQEMLRLIRIPKPRLEVQRELIARAEDALEVIQRLEHAAGRTLSLAERLRRSVLAAAFSGQLVPHDPANEPASVLLNRIRAERQSSVTPSLRRKAPAPT